MQYILNSSTTGKGIVVKSIFFVTNLEAQGEHWHQFVYKVAAEKLQSCH